MGQEIRSGGRKASGKGQVQLSPSGLIHGSSPGGSFVRGGETMATDKKINRWSRGRDASESTRRVASRRVATDLPSASFVANPTTRRACHEFRFREKRGGDVKLFILPFGLCSK